VLHALSYLLEWLRELSNDNNQPSTTIYALLYHDGFNALTSTDVWRCCILSDTKICLCLEH